MPEALSKIEQAKRVALFVAMVGAMAYKVLEEMQQEVQGGRRHVRDRRS